jgi:hypothetical protein
MTTVPAEDCVGVQLVYFIKQDRKKHDDANKPNFSLAQQQKGQKILEDLRVVYQYRPATFLNYHRTDMSVKVCAPKPFEKNSNGVLAYNKQFIALGGTIKEVPGGIVYHFT